MPQVASQGGMYGPDSGSTYRVQALGAPVAASQGSAIDAAMSPGMATGGPAVPVTTYNILPPSIGNAGLLGNTVAWWFALILVLFAIKYLAEHNHEAGEFGTIRVGLLNILIITLCAKIGNAALKMLSSKYRFAGLTDLIVGT